MKLIRPFEQTDEKIKSLDKMIMERHLYAPDEYRTEAGHAALMNHLFHVQNSHEYYEIGDFQGLAMFMDIKDGYKSLGALKIWDSKIWGFRLLKELRELLDEVMEKHDLKKVEFETADPQMARIGLLCGLEAEGRKRDSYMFDGVLYDIYMFGKRRK